MKSQVQKKTFRALQPAVRDAEALQSEARRNEEEAAGRVGEREDLGLQQSKKAIGIGLGCQRAIEAIGCQQDAGEQVQSTVW